MYKQLFMAKYISWEKILQPSFTMYVILGKSYEPFYNFECLFVVCARCLMRYPTPAFVYAIDTLYVMNVIYLSNVY
jgi:hypothetical protein